MKNMTLGNIEEACRGAYVGGEEGRRLEITGAVTDSRQVREGYLFIPIRGARVDGHDLVPQAIAQGAAAALSERPLGETGYPYIQVGSTKQALKDIAEFYRRQLDIPIVGITGSVGKTSTKEMVASVLSEKFRVLKTEGNFNNEIGLPLTLLRIRGEHEAAVVEMGISDFGEMRRLAKMARPDVCVITNIGTCHLENLKTRDGVLKAKSEIFEFLGPQGRVVLNGDDDKLSSIGEVKGIRPVFYGLGEGRDIYADRLESRGLKGMEADIHVPALPPGENKIHASISIPGPHNVYNALASVGVGLSLGMGLAEIQRGIEKAGTIGGRTNLVEAGGLLVIDDCYNANPVSMRASLEVLGYGLGRKVAVLGDMGELGKDERKLHYEIGAYAAKTQADALFCAGELSAEMARGAKEAGKTEDVFYFGSRDEMLPALLRYLREGDTVLVKASHFMEYPAVVEKIRETFGQASS